VPDEPAAAESWAKPTDGGVIRNTEYTFFKKVSPTTQLGFPDPLTMLLPMLRSNIAPRHRELVRDSWPRFMSVGLIGHNLPPNERLMEMLVVQGNAQNPGMLVTFCEPGTAAQIALTSFVGPPIKVVPVSMAESADAPDVMGTDLPCTVTDDMLNSQKVLDS